jgi:tetratricopeptide (TPR) repeat protein
MQRTWKATFLILFGLLATPAPGLAQSQDWTDCFSSGSDDYTSDSFIPRGIEACTATIPTVSGDSLASVYSVRGYWYTRQGNLDAALADLNRAVEMDPFNVEHYDFRADVWKAKGDIGQALRDYQKSISIDPEYAAAYYGAGMMLEAMNRIDEAREHYRLALAAPARDRIAEWAHTVAQARLDALK